MRIGSVAGSVTGFSARARRVDARARRTRDEACDRVLELERALLVQHHRRHRGDRLGHRVDAPAGCRARRAGRPRRRAGPRGRRGRPAPVAGHGDQPAGQPAVVDVAGEVRVDPRQPGGDRSPPRPGRPPRRSAWRVGAGRRSPWAGDPSRRHVGTAAAPAPGRSGPESGRRRGERPRQLPPLADAELGVDARERVLDRLRAEEERRGDLLVRAPAGDEVGDLPLARAERLVGDAAAGTGDAGAEAPQLTGGLVVQAPGPAAGRVGGDALQRALGLLGRPAAARARPASRRASAASSGAGMASATPAARVASAAAAPASPRASRTSARASAARTSFAAGRACVRSPARPTAPPPPCGRWRPRRGPAPAARSRPSRARRA